MNPTPVPAPVLNDTEPADPGRPKLSFNAVTAVFGIAAVVLIGAILSRAFARLHAQEETAEQTRSQATRIGEAFEAFRSETTQVTQSLPKSQQELESRVVELEQVLSATSEQLAMVRQQAGQRQLDNARARAWVTDLHNEGNQLRQELRELEAGVAGWEIRRTALMENDDGKRIAASPSFLELFANMLANPPPKPAGITAWKDRLDILLADIDRAHRQPEVGLTINEALGDDVRQLAREIRRARDSFQEQQAAINAILREIARQPPSAGTPSLAQVLERRRERLALEAEKQRAEAAQRVRDEYREKLAEARAESERIFGETALEKERLTQAGARLLAEIEAQKLTEAADDARREEALRQAERQQQAQKAQLERRFAQQWPRMRTFLVPFTSDGLAQPGGYGFEMTGTKGPVSLGKLRGMGMLEPDLTGMKKLYSATTINRMNDRERGGFPPYVGGDQDWARKHDTIKTIQDFLNEYGELMVEKGLLAP